MLLGEPYGTPIPRQRCCCRSYGCTAPHPPTPRRYGLLPNMSESSGTPGANSVRGSPGFPVGWDLSAAPAQSLEAAISVICADGSVLLQKESDGQEGIMK